MGVEDVTKKGQVEEFFYKKLQRRPGQHMPERVNVFQKAVPDTKAEGRMSSSRAWAGTFSKRAD